MSSISSTSTTLQTQAIQRPAHGHRNRVASEISTELSNGTISSTDATALTSALNSIDASLKSGGSTDGGTAAASTGAPSRLDPSQAKSRVDGLIADQVSSGALTSDQATKLKSLFAEGDKGGANAVGGAGGPPPGPPPGAPPSGDAFDPSSTSADSSATGGTDSTSTDSANDLLASFIKQLQATQSSGTGYASGGSASTNANASALLFDFQS